MKILVLMASFSAFMSFQAKSQDSSTESQNTRHAVASDASGLEEIVVTASKRTERLQDAPVAITALSGEQLQSLGAVSFSDFASLIPSVNEANGLAPGLGTVIMRGLYSGNFQTNSTTATYIGETPFTANAALSLSGLINLEPDILDVDRLEVDKGPQGTLYGASSLAGLIRIIPKEPDPTKTSGQVRLDGSTIDNGGSGGGIRASVNLPLAPNVALRAAGFAKNDPGFTRNIATGHSNLGNTKAEGGSIALKVNFSDVWDAKISGLYQYSDTHGFQSEYDVPGTETPIYGRRLYSSVIDGGSTSRFWLVEGTSNYRFGLGTLTAAVSHAHYAVDITQDGTQNYGALEIALGLSPSIIPAGFNVVIVNGPLADKTTGEVRFASQRIGPIEFLGGMFFTDEHTQYPVEIQNQSSPGVPLRLPDPFTALNNVAVLNSLNSYKEYAGFFNGTYYFTDDIDVTGGVRYSHNDQVIEEVVPVPSLLGLVPEVDKFSGNSVLYQASARWRPTRDLSFYFRAASGYRPGGAQTLVGNTPGIPLSYKADTTFTYEGGLKGRLFDRRLSFSAAAYHTDWKDIHLTAQSAVSYILNGGDAKVDGGEVQIDWADASNFRFGANAGLAKATLVRIAPASAISIGAAAGDRLPGAPRWTASGYGEYRHNVTERLEGSLGATVRYQGDIVSSYPGAPLDINTRLSDYTTLDLRSGLKMGNYSADFRIANVTNTYARTGYHRNDVGTGTAPGEAYLLRPRTFSVSLSAQF